MIRVAADEPEQVDIGYRITTVDLFDEPKFTQLSTSIFPDASRTSARFGDLARDELPGRTRLKEMHSHLMLRVGAFDGEELVGWTVGWFEREGAFYMANSAVLPTHRRKGIYAALVQRCLVEAARGGAAVVRSRHVAENRAIQIAKLKLGFFITGSEYSEEYGFLIRMTYFLREERLKLFLGRSAPLAQAAEKGGQW
jgi:GNAT superfamily N-acetyltransferase